MSCVGAWIERLCVLIMRRLRVGKTIPNWTTCYEVGSRSPFRRRPDLNPQVLELARRREGETLKHEHRDTDDTPAEGTLENSRSLGSSSPTKTNKKCNRIPEPTRFPPLVKKPKLHCTSWYSPREPSVSAAWARKPSVVYLLWWRFCACVCIYTHSLD